MFKINFNNPIHVHFIGIGGISMSGLAEILLKEGFTVSGSDSKESPLTIHLESLGCRIFYGQKADNIIPGIDAVVFTAAIHPDNPEYAEAVRRNIPMLSRADLLGQLMANYKTSIAVSGTHGKTTTTSMLSDILMAAQTDPTISVGGMLSSIGGNIRVGGPDMFLTEACEYTNSFLSFYPTATIILNVEADHLDFFKDLDDIRHSFGIFASQILPGGVLIINSDIEDYEEIAKQTDADVITFALNDPNADYRACDITFNDAGCGTFTLIANGVPAGNYTLSVPGIHNVGNALSAIALAKWLEIPEESIRQGLCSFTGTDRRFQHKGELNGVTIIDDYAHHPTEIKATLNAARNYKDKKIWVIFQPHTYTRTYSLMDDFAEALALADEVILAPIYAARETDTLGISSDTLRQKIEDLGHKALYLPSFEEIEEFVKKNCSHGDLLITMGAGDVVKIGENLLQK